MPRERELTVMGHRFDLSPEVENRSI
jgi:hypothetical protein